nr:hypothetical protein [Tanacetum cinerariifolium]
MANMNMSANDVPAEQAHAIAPPTRTDDKILPICKWVPVSKSNYVLDGLKSQRNLIFKYNIHPRTGLPLHYSHDDNVLANLSFVRKDGKEVFGMPTPDALLTDAITRAPYYDGYLAHIAQYQKYLHGEHGMKEEGEVLESYAPKAIKVTKPSAPTTTKVTKPTGDKASKPRSTSSQPPKPKLASTKPSKTVPKKKQKLVKVTPDEASPAKRSKVGRVGKRRKSKSPLKLVDEFTDEGVPIVEPRLDDEESNLQQGIELSLKDLEARNQGPARPVVFKEPNSRRFQTLPEVQGKRKEKFIEEQAAHDLLTHQNPKKKSPVDEYMFQRRSPTTTGPFGNAESPSLDSEQANSETKSNKTVTPVNKEQDASNKYLTKINAGVQDEGQARSNPGKQHEGEAGLNPVNAVIIEEPLCSTGTVSSLKNLEKELGFTDQFFVEKPQEEETEKTNAESEKSLDRDYSNQLLADLDEGRKKKRMKRNLLRTPSGSPPQQPPPPPPPTGTGALSLSKSTASTPQSMTWITSDTRYESTGFANDVSILDEQVHMFDDEETKNDHLPKADMRKDWWKPLPEEDRPTTPKPAWTIPSSNVSDVEKN